jgi:hypothetical protein
MSEKAHGKKIVLLTRLPNGERLATLRSVERFDSGQVVFETDEEGRSDTIPFTDCIEVEGGETVAEEGLGLGVRSFTVAGLAGEEGGGDVPGLLEAFGVEAGAPVYVVRGGDKRSELHDALRKALGPDPIIVSCPPGYRLRALDEDQMRACGWVRAEEARAEEAQKQRDDASAEAAS